LTAGAVCPLRLSPARRDLFARAHVPDGEHPVRGPGRQPEPVRAKGDGLVVELIYLDPANAPAGARVAKAREAVFSRCEELIPVGTVRTDLAVLAARQILVGQFD